MATFRKTCLWMLAILLIVLAGGGGYAYWFLTQSDELVRGILADKLRQAAPEWNVSIADVRLDLWGRVRVYDLSLQEPDRPQPAVRLPETVVILDRTRLVHEQIIVQRLELLRPELTLIRDVNGRWNLQDIQLQEKKSQPEITIRRGTLTLQQSDAQGELSQPLVLHGIDLTMIPDGKELYRIDAKLNLSQAEKASLQVDWDRTAQTWEVNGTLNNLQLGPELFHEVAGMFPDQVQRWQDQIERRFASQHQQQTEQSQFEGLEASRTERPDALSRLTETLQASASGDVTFQIQQWKPGAPLQFGVKIALRDGRLQNDRLPFPLHDIGGQLFINNSQLIVRELSARNGPTLISGTGKWLFQEQSRHAEFELNVQDLPIDERLRSKLPPAWKKYYDDSHPSGILDVHADLSYDVTQGWKHSSTVDVKNGSVQHVKFPYRVDRVRGTVVQSGRQLSAKMQGMAGDRVLTLTADVRDPGPLAESTVDIYVKRLPIDDKLIAACAPPARKTIQMLDLHGTLDAAVRLYRPPGPGHKHRPHLWGRLRDCTMTYVHFPYGLKNLNGQLEWDAVNWTFTEMTAKHGAAAVGGEGRFEKTAAGGLLDITLTAQNAMFEDEELYQALPPGMQRLSGEFGLQGRFDLDAHIAWRPGSPPVIDLHNIALKQDSLKLLSFPFPFHNVRGNVSVLTNRTEDQRDIIIRVLKADHSDGKHLELTGRGYYKPNGEWHISFDELTVDDLDMGNRFRKAVPRKMRSFFESIDPRGHSISAKGKLALGGFPDKREMIVTASWDIDIYHSGTTITAGVDMKDLYGKVNLLGQWDGESITGSGQIDLDFVTINGYQLSDISGPLLIQRDQFIIGSRDVASGQQPGFGPQAPDDRKRVTAKFIDGTLALDGIATLDEKNAYLVTVQMRNGRVEKYAQLYAPRQKNLRGIINGDVTFDGRGSDPDSFRGRGQVSINPAALYELPVILQITKALSFLPPDKTAFDRAYAKFDVTNRQFLFQRIDLMGNAISLRGFGDMRRSDSRLNLDFYSTVPRNRLPIPLIGRFVNESTEGWVRVRVTGTTDNPHIQDSIVPRLDNPVRSLLGILAPPTAAPPPNNSRLMNNRRRR